MQEIQRLLHNQRRLLHNQRRLLHNQRRLLHSQRRPTATSAQSTADANTQEISNIKADITTVNQQISLIRTIQSDSQAVETRTLSLPVTVTPARYRITFSSQLFNSAEAFYGEWIVSFAGSGTAVVEISKSSNITFSYSDGVCTFSTPFNTSYGRITYETL